MMREKARSAVSQLLSLNTTGATVIDEGGEHQFMPIDQLQVGMTVSVAPGERLPVDGVVLSGTSDIDRSIVTGESMPEQASTGMKVEAGIMNLTGPLMVRVTAVGGDTFLGEVVKLMEIAEQGKAGYMRIADRAAQIYAPVVHLLALATFIGWMVWTGGDWHTSLFTAIAVLIITCPCALGLAVPAVQIVASGMLFKRGILVKDGAALERMSTIDMVAFDKTGTLTTGNLELTGDDCSSKTDRAIARMLVQGSSHPLSKALARALSGENLPTVKLENISEVPGKGIKAVWKGKQVRLGAPDWCSEQTVPANAENDDNRSQVGLSVAGKRRAMFSFSDQIRPEAGEVVSQLKEKGISVALLSGDRQGPVESLARKIGIDDWHASLTPGGKVLFINQQLAAGKNILMVGDGINDAPSLAAATTSMAPSSASDIGQTAADMVFTTPSLNAVIDALDISDKATRHIRQNFGLAIAYNIVAVPLAVIGLATPLVAAVAMSSSSILVTTNALRLKMSAARKKSPGQDKVPVPNLQQSQVRS